MIRRITLAAIPLVLATLTGCHSSSGRSGPDPVDSLNMPEATYGHYARLRIGAAQARLDREWIPIERIAALTAPGDSAAFLRWVDPDHVAVIAFGPGGRSATAELLDLRSKAWSKRVTLPPELFSDDAVLEPFTDHRGALFVTRLALKRRDKSTILTLEKSYKVQFDSGAATPVPTSELLGVTDDRVYLAAPADASQGFPPLVPCRAYNFAGSLVQTLSFKEYSSGVLPDGLFLMDADVHLDEIGRVTGIIHAAYTDDEGEAEEGSVLLAIAYDGRRPSLVRLDNFGDIGLSEQNSTERKLGSMVASKDGKAAAWISREAAYGAGDDNSAVVIDQVHVAVAGMPRLVADWAATARVANRRWALDSDSPAAESAADEDWGLTALTDSPLAFSADGLRLAYIKNGAIMVADLSRAVAGAQEAEAPEKPR